MSSSIAPSLKPPRPPSSPRTYSLRLPPWPPRPSGYPPGRNFKIIYDSMADKDQGRLASLESRVGGKEAIIRYDGEVIGGEVAPVPVKPRKGLGFKRRSGRDAFHAVEYEIDIETGMTLGIVFIRYQTREEATGKKHGVPTGVDENEDLRVVFDGEGLKLKATLNERKKKTSSRA